jgi:predicted TPR repeat methyltransferase
MQNPALNPHIVLAPVENGYLAYDSASEQVHELNPLAALIAELCDGSRSVDEIRGAVTPLLPEGNDSEVERWIEGAIQAGLLIRGDGVASDHRSLSAKELADLAKRLRRAGKVRLAFLCQQTVVKLAPEDADAWCYLGELAHIIGQRDEARVAYEKYLSIEPDDAEVKLILVALRDEAPPSRAPDEFIQQLYERFSSFYDKNICDDLDTQAPDRIRELAQAAVGDRTGLTLLDLGCGTGLAGVQLKPRAARMVGIDLSPEMVELARARNLYDQLEVAEITDWLRRNSECFDLIAACDCLIYFGDLRQIVVPAVSRLHPDGAIVFTVECGDRYPFRLTDSGRYTHHPDHIREVAKEAGLRVLRLEEGYLRMEYGAEVTGLFVALKREPPVAQ